MASNTMITIPSLCLLRVYHKFDSNYVEGVFCELFGPNAYGNSCVENVDMISKMDRNTGDKFWLVFVHFSENMYRSEYLDDFVQRINNDEEVKIQYNPPWFWKARKNTSVKEKNTRTGPRIMSRKDEEEFMKAQREILAERNKNSGKTEETNDESQPFSLDGGIYLSKTEKRREQRKRASEREMERSNSEPALATPPPTEKKQD